MKAVPYLPRLVLGVGVVCLLMSASLCLFIRENSYLGDPTCQRVLSFLADHGYFDPARNETWLYRSPISGDAKLTVTHDDVPGTFICAVLIPRDPKQPVTADTTCPQPGEFRALWAGFDRQRHPIDADVVRAALLKNLSHSLDWAGRYSVHHASGALAGILYGLAWVSLGASLPLLGPQLVLSLCRFGIPLWLSAGVIAAGIIWLRRLRHRG
ncbi:MAG: hypothetical protein AB1563_11775 [Bacillota bacterium]